MSRGLLFSGLVVVAGCSVLFSPDSPTSSDDAGDVDDGGVSFDAVPIQECSLAPTQFGDGGSMLHFVDPDLAVDDDGNYALVWTKSGPEGTLVAYELGVLDGLAGSFTGVDLTVSDEAAGSPSVSRSAANEFGAAWVRDDRVVDFAPISASTTSKILIAGGIRPSLFHDGTTFSAGVVIDPAPGVAAVPQSGGMTILVADAQPRGDIAAASVSGAPAIVWSTVDEEILFADNSVATTTVRPASGGSVGSPDMVGTPNAYAIAWQHAAPGDGPITIELLVLRPGGNRLEVQVFQTDQVESKTASVAFDGNRIGVVWLDRASGEAVMTFASVRPGSGDLEFLCTLAAPPEAVPTEIALAAANGRFAVAWTDESTDPFRIYVSEIAAPQ